MRVDEIKDDFKQFVKKKIQEDPELTAVVRSRQLHIYRNGKKVLVLAGKSAPKVVREDRICSLVPSGL